MNGSGYIYSWQVTATSGDIHVCSPARFKGEARPVFRKDCSVRLRQTLDALTSEIDLAETCPPPASSIEVTFDIDDPGLGDGRVSDVDSA